RAARPRSSARSLSPRSEPAVRNFDFELVAGDHGSGGSDDPCVAPHDRVAALERRPRRQGAQAAGSVLEASALALDHQRGSALQMHVQLVEALARALERPSDAALETRTRVVEAFMQFGDIGNNEPSGRRRRRRADVRRQVAQRRVLLVADRRYDWQRARGDGANESLVAEREQVLEAPAAAREDDDVDVRSRAELLERVDD